jgi:demethylmenaquinone methyltransferase/2-methoxy-6-polyprenyl-1,4-benzoquinol methylase
LVSKYPKILVKQFFENNAGSYEKIINLTTFGRDTYWKKEIVKRTTRCNSILDLACGTGILTYEMAEKFPNAEITGVDITPAYLKIATSKLKPHHKISFILADAERLSLGIKFDCITSSYIPKYCIPNILIEQCLSHLNPSGKIILHDFTYPKNRFIKLLWNLYFAILHVVGVFVPSWKNVFEDLPKLIRSTDWVNQYKDIMERNGFAVKMRYFTLGCSAILTGTKNV